MRIELAEKIARFISSAENCTTEIAGLTLHRKTCPTAPCSMTYHPSVTVMAQGRKRVELAQASFIYGPGQCLLTAVDLPVVSRIVEASEQAPCLALSLKIELAAVRELLSREEIPAIEPPPDRPAMSSGKTPSSSSMHAAGWSACWKHPAIFRFLAG